MKSTLRLLAWSWFAATCLLADERLTTVKISALEKLIAEEMASQRIPGLSAAVGTGIDVWAQGYGIADLENQVPAKANTVYRTASVAKPMTAIAAMQLVEKGKLSLDAPIQKYLPSFPVKPWPVTLRQLLGHLGGIRHYRDPLENYLTHHSTGLADAVKMFEADPLALEPGTRYLYSTFGFVLAGRVVEAASGAAYLDYMKEHVFRPAGMAETDADDVYRVIPNRARGYQKTIGGQILNCALHDTSYKLPGGGLVSTAPDLVRMALAVQEGKLLQPASVEVMLASQFTRDGVRTGYGLGWGNRDLLGRRLYLHSGGQAGVASMLVSVPSERMAIALMCNLEGAKMEPFVDRLVEVLLAPVVP